METFECNWWTGRAQQQKGLGKWRCSCGEGQRQDVTVKLRCRYALRKTAAIIKEQSDRSQRDSHGSHVGSGSVTVELR